MTDSDLQAIPEGLFGQIRALIGEARQQALRAVDVVQVQTCWQIGRHIVEFEQNGAERAMYGARLLPRLAERLTAEFGRGFDASNLRNMRQFFLAFPICDALRRELSWTHYRSLLRVDNAEARQWYMNEAADQNWSTRALERQIGTLYYERLLSSRERQPVLAEAARLEFNERLKAVKQGTGRWKSGRTRLERLLGKELCVLAWAAEDAELSLLPVICTRWGALRPEERWWLFAMTVAEAGLPEDRERGWRKALRAALSDGTKTTTEDRKRRKRSTNTHSDLPLFQSVK